jgi:hypothetical protein
MGMKKRMVEMIRKHLFCLSTLKCYSSIGMIKVMAYTLSCGFID